MVNYKNEIEQILKDNKGMITSTQVTEAGIPRRMLSELCDSGEIYKVERGIYALPESWEDELFLLQYHFSRGIFSHETALFIHGLTDRTPIRFTMTFPFGYNTANPKKKGVIAKTCNIENYDLGIVTGLTHFGNTVKLNDIERTLCDIVKTRHSADVQIVNQAMKLYAYSDNINLAKLTEYAERLRVKDKIMRYMEVLL